MKTDFVFFDDSFVAKTRSKRALQSSVSKSKKTKAVDLPNANNVP